MQPYVRNPCGEILLSTYGEPPFHITKVFSQESYLSTMRAVPHVIEWVRDNFVVGVDYECHDYQPDVLFITDRVAVAVNLRFL